MQNWHSDRAFGMKSAPFTLNKSWFRAGWLVIGVIATAALAAAQTELATAEERWLELELLRGEIEGA